MKHKIGSILLYTLLYLFTINNCTILEIKNPKPELEIKIAPIEAKCNKPVSMKQWTILYGTIPLSFLNKNPQKYLKPGSIRIAEKAYATDMILSSILGLFLSISVKTIEIENCPVDMKEMPKEIPKTES